MGLDMGRSTPSLRVVVRDYVERFKRAAEMLPREDRALVDRFLEDLETTLSAYMHVGSVDPLEVLILHLVRKMRELCTYRES